MEKMSWPRRGIAFFTVSKSGGGLPRQKFESVHVAFRSRDSLASAARRSRTA
jgi:hypothetical protein